jgi:hypothetical protein
MIHLPKEVNTTASLSLKFLDARTNQRHGMLITLLIRLKGLACKARHFISAQFSKKREQLLYGH